MTQDTNDLHEIEKRVRTGGLTSTEIYSLLYDLGYQGKVNAETLVAEFLDSNNGQLRRVALLVLCHHWGLMKYAKTCEEYLLRDPDVDVRSMAALCLGTLYAETFNSHVLRILKRVLSNGSEHWMVRETAYRALLVVIDEKRRRREVPLGMNFETDVDWNLIQKMIPDE